MKSAERSEETAEKQNVMFFHSCPWVHVPSSWADVCVPSQHLKTSSSFQSLPDHLLPHGGKSSPMILLSVLVPRVNTGYSPASWLVFQCWPAQSPCFLLDTYLPLLLLATVLWKGLDILATPPHSPLSHLPCWLRHCSPFSVSKSVLIILKILTSVTLLTFTGLIHLFLSFRELIPHDARSL